MEDDGESPYTVDLSSLPSSGGTDDQQVDSFLLQGNTLILALEDDSQAPHTVDLSGIGGADGNGIFDATNNGNFVPGAFEAEVDTTLTFGDTDNSSTGLLVDIDNTTGEFVVRNQDGDDFKAIFDMENRLIRLGNETTSLPLLQISHGVGVGNDILDFQSSTIQFGYDANNRYRFPVQQGPTQLSSDTSFLIWPGALPPQQGGWMTLADLRASIVSGDNWGSQVVQTTARISGDGTIGNELDIAQNGATIGQALVWNGGNWVPATFTETDDQTLSLNANSLSIEDGNSVDLSGYLDNTDNQTVDTFALNGNILTLALENDNEIPYTVDLSGLGGGGLAKCLFQHYRRHNNCQCQWWRYFQVKKCKR